MLKQPIVAGKAYVNEDAGIIREVIEEIPGERVRFNAFELCTGKLIPSRHRTCQKQQMAQWAHREASQPETALVHPYDENAAFEPRSPHSQEGVQLEQAKAMVDGIPGHYMMPHIK